MSKSYGIRGEIQGFPFKDLKESFETDGILLEIHEGILDVSFDHESDRQKAEEVASAYLHAWSLRNGRKIKVDFNHSWEPNQQGGTHHRIGLSENIKVSERLMVHQVNIHGKANIVTKEMHDSASFINESELVKKVFKDQTLRDALRYYGEEVVDDDRPLYGIYKALEAIAKHLGKNGRKTLAGIAGVADSYVNDVMETTQLQRHHLSGTAARKKLSDADCKERAKILIEAYALSIS